MSPHEDIEKNLISQWLAKADEDLSVAQHLWAEDSPYLAAIAFHSQQAAEKYLKAYLVKNQVEFPKTHDLDKILDLIAEINSDLAESLQDADKLTVYGVDIRYPGDFPDMNSEKAEEAVTLATMVRDAVMPFLIPGK